MGIYREFEIDGCSVFLEELDPIDKVYDTHDAKKESCIVTWATNQIVNTLRPALTIMKSLHEAAMDMKPSEMNASMKFSLGLKGEVPVIKIVSSETSAQFELSFSWKHVESSTVETS